MTWQRIWPALGPKPRGGVQNQLRAFVLDRIVQHDMEDTILVSLAAPPAVATLGIASIHVTQYGRGPHPTRRFSSGQTQL